LSFASLTLFLVVNFGIMPQPLGVDESSYTELEKQGIKRGEEFKDTGSAYALLHATRPSTIAFSLSASPLALLPWLAEKFLTWSDPSSPPSLDLILQETTLYWFTDTFSTSIYPYRQLFTPGLIGAHENPRWKIPKGKGFGFSWFPFEIAPVPKAWVEMTTEEGRVDVSVM
jgi:microsomal epoxide hydrolase